METNIHAHIARSSSDCDGSYFREYVMVPNDDERAHSLAANGVNDFSELMFRDRVMTHVASPYATTEGTLFIRSDDESSTVSTLEWHERTDEGGVHTLATFCTLDCDEATQVYRDFRAEEAGY